MNASVVDIAQLRRGCAQCTLQQLCLPAGIDRQGLQRLEEIVRRRRPIAAGERLFRTGDPLEAIYVARSGAFKTITISPDGEEQVIGFHLPGELFGLDALGTGAHRCEAVALATANVCEVPFDALAEVAAQLPSVQQQLLRVIGRSFGRNQDHLGMLVRRQAHERLALFLHGISERLRQQGESAERFRLPMSREDIARYLGLALETISRGFSRLQDDGLITVNGRRVELLDAPALMRIAHVDVPTGAERRRAGA